MSKSNLSEEFQRDAVRQITERAVPLPKFSQMVISPKLSTPLCHGPMRNGPAPHSDLVRDSPRCS